MCARGGLAALCCSGPSSATPAILRLLLLPGSFVHLRAPSPEVGPSSRDCRSSGGSRPNHVALSPPVSHDSRERVGKLSIVVPTYNRRERLGRVLRALGEQST